MCGSSPGAVDTFAEQVCMPINGRVQCIDRCIHQIVAALNAGGVGTIASCCGHGKMVGTIMLSDGRELIIAPNFEMARTIETQSKILFNKKVAMESHGKK